jgi:ABC-2 type transport system permease protein
MNGAVAITGLTARSVVSRARLLALVALGALGVAVAWRVGATDQVAHWRVATKFANGFGLAVLAPLVALVFGAAAFGDLVDDQTLVYVWARPVRQRTIVSGAYVAAVAVALPLTLAPVLAGAAIVTSNRSVLAGTAAALALGSIAYTSLFLLMGLLTRRALAWGIAYILIVEAFIARGGSSLGFIAIRSHTASILEGISGQSVQLGYYSTTTSVIWLSGLSICLLGLSAWRLSRAEVP